MTAPISDDPRGAAAQVEKQLVPLSDEQLDTLVVAWHELRINDFYGKIAGRGDVVAIEVCDPFLDAEHIAFLASLAQRHSLSLTAMKTDDGGPLFVLQPLRSFTGQEGLRAGFASEDGELPGTEPQAQAEPDETRPETHRISAFGDSILLEFARPELEDVVVSLPIARPEQIDVARQVLETVAGRILTRLDNGDTLALVVAEEREVAARVFNRALTEGVPTGEES